MSSVSVKIGKINLDLNNLVYPKLIVISLILNVLVILLILIFRSKLPPQIPLFYGAPEGEEQLGSQITLLLPSIISIAITSINSLLSLAVSDDFLKKVLVSTGIAVTIFSVITSIKIAFLVGSF